jgi:hypothetical protein
MSMNLFRLAGDMSHVFSIIVLLLRLRVVKNAAGEDMITVLSIFETSHGGWDGIIVSFYQLPTVY